MMKDKLTWLTILHSVFMPPSHVEICTFDPASDDVYMAAWKSMSLEEVATAV
jgi:hypothetical protein